MAISLWECDGCGAYRSTESASILVPYPTYVKGEFFDEPMHLCADCAEAAIEAILSKREEARSDG